MQSIIEKAQRYMISRHCPYFVRMAVNRKDPEKDPKVPFQPRMEEDSRERYLQVWQRIVGYIYRTFPGEGRPPYRFTGEQQARWQAFIAMVEDMDEDGVASIRREPSPSVEEAAEDEEQDEEQDQEQDEEQDGEQDGEQESEPDKPDEPPKLTAVERAGLRAWISWLDDDLKDGEYVNPIVSATAVLGYDAEQETWTSALNYTPRLSAIIKLARMMVVIDALDRQTEHDSVQREVQRQVNRFMTTREPSPMNWMYILRTYGQRIRYTTTAGGMVQWEGETVSYGRTKFSMS